MLKPALSRGELHCIGATTLDEYRKYIEKDAALERRFQKVIVGEPSVEATIYAVYKKSTSYTMELILRTQRLLQQRSYQIVTLVIVFCLTKQLILLMKLRVR